MRLGGRNQALPARPRGSHTGCTSSAPGHGDQSNAALRLGEIRDARHSGETSMPSDRSDRLYTFSSTCTPNEKRKASLQLASRKRVEALLGELKELSYEKLKSNKTLELICPDIYDRQCYWYIGQVFSVTLLKFIVDPPIRLSAVAEAPCKVLHEAFILAYIKDPQALASLEDFESEEDVEMVLWLRTETVHIVVDYANSMEDEAVAYLKHTSGKTEEGCRLRARRIHHYTGWVPGLLSQYLTKKCVVEQTRRKGVSDALHSDDEVLTAVTEGRLKYELSDALDSGCYF
ncbi:hypothetical protein SELMODRAFT_423481 [Selaginella moellendorffii]|uniref:Uncharacterized protein n=1 Tax=Selaginella moellendorffii TaxID=88036 RepID=D8SLU9_SELML|nr:hypothetical protein SELMODRAFT_423481 [Selaginella moellendorffii]